MYDSARFPVVTNGAYLPPGQCVLCGRAGSQDPVGMVDTRVEVEKDFGLDSVLYICSPCVVEMASQYGCIPYDLTVQVYDIINTLVSDIEMLSRHIEQQEKVLEGYGALPSFTEHNPVTVVSTRPDVAARLRFVGETAERVEGLARKFRERQDAINSALRIGAVDSTPGRSEDASVSDEPRSTDSDELVSDVDPAVRFD